MFHFYYSLFFGQGEFTGFLSILKVTQVSYTFICLILPKIVATKIEVPMIKQQITNGLKMSQVN